MITVFGSINVDLTFPLPQLPAVGETVLAPACSGAVGGKGANQAVAAARDGAETRFIGCVGSDEFGTTARRALADAGVDVTGLATVPDATGLAAVWIDGDGRNMIAVASGANGAVRADALDARTLAPGSLVVLQMEVPTKEVETAIARAKGAGSRVLLNLAPALALADAALRQVDILVLNEHEAASLCRRLGLVGSSAEAHLHALAGTLAADVVVTLGPAGAIAMNGGTPWRADALTVTPVDTTGAGDCFVGVLAAGLSRGVPFHEAMQRAAAAGSLACTVVGALPSFPTRPQIETALDGTTAPSGNGRPA